MRITISLDDQLAEQVRREAAARGTSMSAFISRALDDALNRRDPPEQPPFQLVTVRGHPRPGVDLGRPTALEIQDDETRYGAGKSVNRDAGFGTGYRLPPV